MGNFTTGMPFALNACLLQASAPGMTAIEVNGGFKLGLCADAVWKPSREMLGQAQWLIEQRGSGVQGAKIFEELSDVLAAAGGGGSENSPSYRYEGARDTTRTSSILGQDNLKEKIQRCLRKRMSQINADLALRRACSQCNVNPENISKLNFDDLLSALTSDLKLLLKDDALRETLRGLRELQGGNSVFSSRRRFDIIDDADILKSRVAAKEFAHAIGLSLSGSTKVATVVSELARNIIQYATSGTIELQRITRNRRLGVQIIAKDDGPGIPHLDRVLSGRWRSKTGLGMGLTGSKKLMTTFEVETVVGKGTTVTATFLE